tara:strand:- start:229 stop:450 length:222 start_codon:yes stop_codon:yes gene_type:complete
MKIAKNDNESINLEEENLKFFDKEDSTIHNKKVNLNDLLARLQSEKKAEKKSNLLISVAAVSAVAAFGVFLTL